MNTNKVLINLFKRAGIDGSLVLSYSRAFQVAALLLPWIIFYSKTYAQENIPLGTWRTHLSFSSVQHVASGDNFIFAASDNGVLRYDQSSGETTVYSTLNALSASSISSLHYDRERSQLLVGYEDGNLDLIQETKTINFSRLVNPSDIAASPAINHISVNNSIAYLSTAYGVVVFDLQQNEVRETWRNLGASGQLLLINESVIKDDSIYLATGKGVLAGNFSDNLLDFTKWLRYDIGDLNAPIPSITLFKSKIYAAINTKGVFRFSGSSWINSNLTPVNTSFSFINGEEDVLLVGINGSLWEISTSVNEIIDPLIQQVEQAIRINGKRWIADSKSGLITDQSGNWQFVSSNGPASSRAFRIKRINDSNYVTHSGYTDNFQSANPLQRVSKFAKGLWESEVTDLRFATDLAQGPGQAFYISSFGEGLEKKEGNGTSTIFNSLNSPLENNVMNAETTYVPAILSTQVGVWVTNFGATKPLHLLKHDGNWLSFSFTNFASRYPFDMQQDFFNNVWLLLAPNGGGGAMVVKSDGSLNRFLSTQPGSGGLPSDEVLSIDVDKNGYVWIGTSKGVAYYTFPGEDGIKPIVDGRFLLSEERVNAIEVDAGNRKWIGTERGLWLFNETGEVVIYNFTTANSPLLSNNIIDLEIDPVSGEVFISTDKGLISFRADATEATISGSEAKVFPNPVTRNFSGLVGITNVHDNAVVKITSMSGQLINELKANGGTASWNLSDYTGKRVTTGIYLVIASTSDGGESIAGKIVVID
jgi:hypothetical protein